MGKLEAMRTPSTRHEVGSENRPANIGCMSGILHFLSRQHSRSQKRLTSAMKKEKPTVIVTIPLKRTLLPQLPPVEAECKKKEPEPQRHSLETPRSPVVPQEIRRPSAASASPDSPRRQTALVARLMGLEDIAPATNPVGATPSPPPADKRRELLRALEKCDEDLKALKRIIEAVRMEETQTGAAFSPVRSAAGQIELDGGDSTKDCAGEQPSPVSVLEGIASPRRQLKISPNEEEGTPTIKSRFVKQQRMSNTNLLAEEEGTPTIKSRFVKQQRMSVRSIGQQHKYAPEIETCCFGARNVFDAMPNDREQLRRRRRRGASRALAESVEEVWADGVWERWEAAWVGMWVEDDILWDLVEDIVVELLIGWCNKLSLSRGTSRKRLRF